MNKKILALSIFSCISIQIQAQDFEHRFCIGEKDTECDTKPVYSCPQQINRGAGDWAKDLCTINTANGPKIMDYTLEIESSKGGNMCGYTVFKVTCFRGTAK